MSGRLSSRVVGTKILFLEGREGAPRNMHGLCAHTLNWDGGIASIENAEGCREGESKCGMAISKRTVLLDRQGG